LSIATYDRDLSSAVATLRGVAEAFERSGLGA
jgi:hypothetical protein